MPEINENYMPPIHEAAMMFDLSAPTEVAEEAWDVVDDTVEAVVDTAQEVTEATQGRLRRMGSFMINLPHVANEKLQQAYIAVQNDPVGASKRAGRGLIIGAEISPVNELARGAIFAYTHTKYGIPLVSAAALGAGTFALEGGAAVAGAKGITESKAMNWLYSKLEKIGLREEVKLPGVVKGAAAYLGGSLVAMALRAREDRDMTPEQNRRYGLKAAAALSGVVAVQGYMATKGFEQPDKETIALAASAVAGPFVAGNYVMSRFKRRTA
jgi:hypothetical protein